MNKRIGDRRGRQRFEIVGNLTGTLEIWQPLSIRNLSAAGALVETATAFAVGDRISGRLVSQGRGRDVRGEVRRVFMTRSDAGEKRYFVGIEWTSRVDRMDELLALRPDDADQTTGRDVERRRSHRLNCYGQAEIGHSRWTTVELVDISGSGVLFLSPEALAVGDKGRLKVRLGEHSLTADVEIRRESTSVGSPIGHRVGALFVALDEGNRQHLEEFVGDRRQ